MDKKKPDPYKIVFGAIALIIERGYSLIKALAIPLLLFYAIDLISMFEPPAGVVLILVIPKLLLYTIFAIITHRILLLGPNSVPPWGVSGWTHRETYFAIHLFALSALIGIAFFTSLMSQYLGVVLGYIVYIYIGARLSLVFPASAIDHGLTFKSSWQISKNHQLLMMFIVFISPIIYALPGYLANQIPHGYVLATFFNILGTIFIVGALSVAYSEIYKYEYSS